MALLKNILRWIIGLAGLMSFLTYVLDYPLLSFLYFFSFVYILPYTHNRILGKLGIHLNRITRYVIFAIAMILVSKSIPDDLRAKWDADEKKRELSALAEKKINDSLDRIIEQKQNEIIAEAGNSNEDNIVKIGEVGYINTFCVGAITEEGYDEMMKLSYAKDEVGLDKLVEYGAALQLETNTQVKVIETGLIKQRVRVMSGKNKGASVYLPAMLISK